MTSRTGPFLAAHLTALLLLLTGCGNPQDAQNSMQQTKNTPSALEYPVAQRGDAADEYHGTRVSDPYRWMEDLDSESVRKWVEAENTLADPYLKNLPGYENIRQRLTTAWDYEKTGLPVKRGSHYFYEHNDGLQDQDVLYVAHSAAPGEEHRHVLLDPNTLSEDGTIALSSWVPDERGLLLAYSTSDGGSDWDTWHVRDVEKREDLSDRIEGTKFTGVSWRPDGSGFFYSRYPAKDGGGYDDTKPVAVYFHEIGTPQSDDELVYALEHESRNPYAQLTEDGRYLIVSIFEGYLTNAIHYIDQDEPESGPVKLLDEWDAQYSFAGNDGPIFYFETTLDAPNNRMVAIDIREPAKEHWREIIPESSEALQGVAFTGGYFAAKYLKDAYSLVRIYDREGNHIRDVELPGIGSASGFGGRQDDPETYFSFSGFTVPGEIYRYNMESGESMLVRRSETSLDLDQFETKQVFYASKDGTKVPMFVVHKKGLKLDGSNPTLLYGYGGFNVSLTPSFSVSRAVWMQMGGVLAVANLRGGGEYGENWHKAGTKLQKQNVFDDFIAAAEYLVEQKYTRAKKLAIQGGSNGGLLVGAAITQRPELFGAALPAVGVLDMLRYHTPSANARQWSSDYGLSENPEEFAALYAYSPYHNVRPGTCYPPTLVTTADRDDRVVPWHSFKFAAALQATQGCANPVLIRVETRAGHGAGKPTWMIIENIADQWTFLAHALEMTITE